MPQANGSLAQLVSSAEPPTLPRAAKRRRTGLQCSSTPTSRSLRQTASAGCQGDLAARLAGVEAREVAVALREGFCERLEAELSARVALLEAQAAAAVARAAGGDPPADMGAQAHTALRILQALAADGGLPTEVRRSRQHMQRGPAAAASEEHAPVHLGRRGAGPATADGPAAQLAHDGMAHDRSTLPAFKCQLRSGGDAGDGCLPPVRPSTGQPEQGGRGHVNGDISGTPPAGRGGQPAFSQHSHHSTMSHATAIGNPNDSPDSPRSHPRFLPHQLSATPSPLPRSQRRQQPAAGAWAQHVDTTTPVPETLDSQLDEHATPGHHSCSGSPNLSAATGPSSDRFSNGGLRSVPRSPFAGPPQETGPQRLHPESRPAAASLAPHSAPYSPQRHAEVDQVVITGILDGYTSTVVCPPSRGLHASQGAPARQPLPAAAGHTADACISRMNSADNRCARADGSAHGGVRIRLSTSAPRLDVIGTRVQQQVALQHEAHASAQRRASDELHNSRPTVEGRRNSADKPLVVTDARQPGLDSLANVAAADADGADLPLLPASSGVKPPGAGADTCAGRGQQLPPAFSFQPPSPTATCRSRAGSVAADDLAWPCDKAAAQQQPQTLQQAVKKGAAHAAASNSASQAPIRPQGGASDRRLKTAAGARATAASSRDTAPTPATTVGAGAGPSGSTQLPLAFSKTLDYKSCDHILCLTKDMARQLLPPAPHSCTATGSSCQMQVELVDPAGRAWPMTYRSVPARYSYEFRAGWKAFAAHWGIATGDAITLRRETDNRYRLKIQIMHGESSGMPNGTGKAAKGGVAATLGAASASAGGHSGGLAATGNRRNSGGGIGAGGLNPAVVDCSQRPHEPAQSAAMAPLLAAVQQAAEHMDP